MNLARLARVLLARMVEAEGQILAEYGLLLGIVVVAVVGVLVLLGGAVSTPFTTFVDAAGMGSS